MKDAIAQGNGALDQIAAQDPAKVTFKSTVVALDDLTYPVSVAANKATIIKQTNTNAAMRAAGENAVKVFQEWAVGIDYREDVYKAIKAFADTHPKLSGEDEKLLKETLRDYRRAGLELSPDKRKEVEQLRKEFVVAVKKLDKAAAKRVVHPNMAARKKSQLARAVNAKEAAAKAGTPAK